MRFVRTATVALCVAAVATLAARNASAAPLITNGGFEPDLTGWTTTVQTESGGTFSIQTGATSPANGIAVPATPEGTNAAMSEGQGPGSRLLYQDFVVPVGVTAGTLSFQLYIANDHSDFVAPSTLDYALTTTPPSNQNQQARVDIITTTADVFSVGAADVLQSVYRTNPGDPLISGYLLVSTDISALLAAHAGQTLRLRFAAVDNVAPMRVGVDDVSLDATVPEPTTLAMFGLASLLVGIRRRA